MSADAALWRAYASLTAQAVIPIALGSFKSLKTPPAVLARRKKAKSTNVLSEDTEDEEDEGLEETLTWADTLLFPVFGSITLLGLWLVIKYLGSEWINRILGVYFTGAGMFAVHSTFGSIINFTARNLGYKPPTCHIRITKNLKQIFHLPVTLPSAVLAPVSIGLPLLYIALGRPWILSNLIALCLAVATLALLRLDSFLTAGVLLSALLVYDIFWVFATPVMVTVAKSIDAPIKLLAPKSSANSSVIDYAMLGLGDVVIPGLMVALCLRFDLHQHAKRHPTLDVGPRSSFSRPYWWTGMISYIVGLGVTIGVMHTFQKAQPALLYLSPACVLGPVLTALVRGELKDMWTYSDAPEEIAEKLDDSIEPGSEVARKARESAKAAAQAGFDLVDHAKESVQEAVDGLQTNGSSQPVEEDDSWMDSTGVSTGTDSDAKARKRKGKKK